MGLLWKSVYAGSSTDPEFEGCSWSNDVFPIFLCFSSICVKILTLGWIRL